MAALSKRDIEMIFRAETDAAQRPVNELSADVRRLRQTLDDLSKASGKTDKSLETLAATTREREQAQQELTNARTLLTQLNAQASALDRAEVSAEKAAKKYNELKTQVDGAEAPTKRLVTSLAAAERGMLANNARLEEAKKSYKEVKASIEGIIGPVDNIQDAFRSVAVAQREITQGLVAAKGSVSAFKTEIADVKIEAERLSQVDAFRKLAADSLAATSAADRIQANLNAAVTPAQRLSSAILGIINPTVAASTTLDGMEAKIDSVVSKISGDKLRVSEWNHLNNELQSVQAGLIRVSDEVDKFTSQQSRVDDAAGAYERQAKKVRELAQAEVAAGTSVESLTADLVREQTALTSLGTALDRETGKLREMGSALQRLGIDSNNLPAAIQRIESTATRAAPAIQEVANVITPGGGKGFLGLDAFQLQNLSYQVNDVFTSLGSGAPPLQVLAQQGGQILQIFPGILSTFASFLPVIAPLAAGFIVLAGAVSESNAQISTLRNAQSVLASLGEANGYDASKFQQIVEGFRAVGASADEANQAAKIFVTEGLNPAAVDDYIIAAKNLADVQGIDLKDATDELTRAFTAGADEVIKLDDKYHFLTDTQRENLIASKDTKDEYNEVNKAFSALYTKMQAGANAARGPMTEATNTLRQAWRGLLNTFADTGIIESVTNYLANAVTGFAFLINVAKRSVALFKGAGDAYNSVGGGFLGMIAAAGQIGSNVGGGGVGDILAGAAADTRNQAASARVAATRAIQAPGADAGAGSRGRRREREKDDAAARKKAASDAKKAARDAESERKKREREAEQLAKQYANEQDQLQAGLSRFTAEAMRGQQAPLEQQLELAKQAVNEQFKALEDRLNEFKAKFGSDAKINGMSQEAYAAALSTQKQQIVLAKQLGVYESNVNNLLKSRDEKLKTIREQQDSGLISAQTALDQVREVTSSMGPQIDGAIESARQFIAALKPSAETQALLDKFSRIQTQSSGPEAGQTKVREQAKLGVAAQEQKINDVLQRRAMLIDAANKLYDIGAISHGEKEQRIQAAYQTTNGELTAQIALLKEYLTANRELFPPEIYERALAQIQEYNTQLKYTSELAKAVKTTAEQSLAGGIMSMFDTLAQGIANVITGAGSLKDLFSDLGRAALQFAAQFLQAIAQSIMQIYALRIAKSLIGGFHGGGTVGDYGRGQMKLSRSIGGPDLNLSAVPRYHEGTAGAGLKSNEMLAVLQKGERVQTEEQQRLESNRLKAAQSGGTGSIRQVLAFGDDQVAAAMAGSAGERTTVTHIRRNATLIKSLLRD